MSQVIEPGNQVSIIPPFVRNCSLRLVVRTLASHAGNRGSSPLGSTKRQRPQPLRPFLFRLAMGSSEFLRQRPEIGIEIRAQLWMSEAILHRRLQITQFAAAVVAFAFHSVGPHLLVLQ
jgi:hypothetical protein